MPYLTEKELAPAAREKIPVRLFVFPKEKTWPFDTLKRAKTALTWSTWPQHKEVAKKVRETVFKHWKRLRNWFKGGKYAKEAAQILGVSLHEANEMRRRSIVDSQGNLGTFGDVFRDRLEAARALMAEDVTQALDFKLQEGVNTIVEAAEEAVLVTFGHHGHSLSGQQKDALRGLLGRLAKEVSG
jgi:hypothetical protein